MYVDKPYEVVKWETREIEVPVEKIVMQEVERVVEVPCVETRVEYVDRIVERDVVVKDDCISEMQFCDLWNRMLTIPRHGLRDGCLTADRFIQLVEAAGKGHYGGERIIASHPVE